MDANCRYCRWRPILPIRNAKTPEYRIHLLESLLGAGIWTYDLSSREVTWSSGLFRLIGLDAHSVMASTELYESLIHPDDRLTHEEILEKAGTGELSLRRFRIIRPDGRLIWVESRTERQYDRSGRMAVLHGVVQEISEQEKLRTDYVRLATLNTSLTKIAGGDLWRANPDGKLPDFSNWMRFTGQSTEQLKDYNQLSAIHPDDRSVFRDAWAQGIATRQKIELSVRVQRRDGIYQRFNNKIVPVMDGQGVILEWHGMSWPTDDVRNQSGTAPLLGAANIRAARALLDWSAQELAEFSEISFSTIRRMERDATSVKLDSVERVRKTLESQGIVFLLTPEGQVSVTSIL